MCLGADTRATGGQIVADKNCEKVCLKRAGTRCPADTKIHYLTPNIRCCGAGTAADTECVPCTRDSSRKLIASDT